MANLNLILYMKKGWIVTTFDIECFEDAENPNSLKNVVAIHKLISVALSINVALTWQK